MVVVFIPGQGEVRQTVEVTESLADRKGVITVILKAPPVDTTSLRNRHTVSARELTISEGARREYAAAERELKRLDVPAARRHFERAVTLAPQFAAAWNYLGTLSYQAGNYAEAERMFRRALQAGPGTFEPVVNLGGVLLNLGRYQEALAYNQHATLERPRDALSQSQLGMNYFFLGQLVPAREHLRIAKRLDPAHFSQPQLVLAEIYLRLGDRTAALHEWREYLVLHPDAQNASKVRQSIRKLESQPATRRREVNVGKDFGNVRIVISVPVPGPTSAWVETLSGRADLLETGAVNPPDIALLGR